MPNPTPLPTKVGVPLGTPAVTALAGSTESQSCSADETFRLAQGRLPLHSLAMNRVKLICFLALCLAPSLLFAQPGQPLRIFLRAGPKTHGPGQHDGPRWLAEWKPLLAGRG